MLTIAEKNIYVQHETIFEAEKEYKLHYQIIKNGEVYSLIIIMTEISDGTEELCDKTFIYDVTSDEETAMSIMEMFCKNSITPCTAHSVIEDLIPEFDFHLTH